MKRLTFAQRVFDQRQKTSLWKGGIILGKRGNAKQEDGLKVKCDKCEKVFKYTSEYQMHFVKSHYFRIKCGCCKKKFKTFRILKIHHQRQHKKDPVTKPVVSKHLKTCKLCGNVFIHESNLSKHLQTAHQAANLASIPAKCALTCRHCRRTFKYSAALKTHLSHHGLTPQEILIDLTKPNLLPVRGNVYPKKKSMHKKRHTETVTCEKCSRQFSSLHTLNLHMIQKHDTPLYIPKAITNPPSTKWQCQEQGCEFSGRTSTMLTQHIREHHPHINFACHKCKYKTPIKSLYDK